MTTSQPENTMLATKKIDTAANRQAILDSLQATGIPHRISHVMGNLLVLCVEPRQKWTWDQAAKLVAAVAGKPYGLQIDHDNIGEVRAGTARCTDRVLRTDRTVFYLNPLKGFRIYNDVK